MTIKLIAIDMDRTLLNSDHKISPFTKETLQKVHQRGVKIVLCTGRPLAGVTDHLEELGLSGRDEFVITHNGALIQELTGQILIQHALKARQVKCLIRFADQFRIHSNFVDPASRIITTNHEISPWTVVQAYENSAGIEQIELNELDDSDLAAKVVYVDEPERLDDFEVAFRQTFDQQYYAVRSESMFFEVLNAKTNKGNALRELATALHLKANEVMAIGDERNDLPMLDFADYSVAMGNAIDLVKQKTNYQTTDNDHDGVGQIVSELVLKK